MATEWHAILQRNTYGCDIHCLKQLRSVKEPWKLKTTESYETTTKKCYFRTNALILMKIYVCHIVIFVIFQRLTISVNWRLERN